MAADTCTRLHARALRWLAQREHSRSELRARLLMVGRTADDRPESTGPALAALVDAVLEQLQAQGYLSDQRFIDSRVHARQGAWGARRIRHELRQHGLALDDQQQQQLDASERARAQALWARRFGTVAEAPAERARQMRFLAARGFSGEAIRHAVGGGGDDDEQPLADDA